MPRQAKPGLDSLSMIGEDGARKALHPSDVSGRWQRLKRRAWIPLIAFYLAIPWIEVAGRPAILIDIPKRQFFLFGGTYNAQDVWMLIFVALLVGITLFTISATYGRAWCGFGCPQTVFLEGVYRRIERFFDGKHVQRRALAAAPWTTKKIFKRLGKWTSWLAVSLVLTHTLLAYFMPIRELIRATTSPPAAHPTAFAFVAITTGLVYFNFAWFREQLCIVICPYGRLQSVLYDEDTVQVAYDHVRGEPRGKFGDESRASCVDCGHCVAVCPTGIDIRNGTQLECVGCANCIDACDAVMDKIEEARGLIRMASQREIEGGVRRTVRPRTVLYAAVFCALFAGLAVVLGTRKSFEAKLLRQAGAPMQRVVDGVQNAFVVHVVNKTAERRRFAIEVDAPPAVRIIQARDDVMLESFSDTRIPIFARFAARDLARGSQLRVAVRVGEEVRTLELVLLGGLAQ